MASPPTSRVELIVTLPTQYPVLLLECGVAGEGCLELAVVYILVETDGNKCSWAPWLDIHSYLNSVI